MIREELLALADELEGMDVREGCRSCPADGTKDCRGDLSCEEAVARAAARRVREIIEHDECEVTTVSAYDLLSEEDREALAWVREMGGVEAAEKRLMPEGMEWLLEVWPKWSNGEYCKFGDWWTADKYGDCEPKQLRSLCFYTPEQLKEWEQDEGDNYGYEWDFMRPSDTNYRPDKAETPASKILAADGEPLEVGQTVWDEHCEELVVLAIYGQDVHCRYAEFDDQICDNGTWEPSKLTHQRPVLDADGVPIKVGETVWDVETGVEFEVSRVEGCSVTMSNGGYYSSAFPRYCPSKLTHAKPEQPDTWERLEHDAEKTVCEYFGANYDCANCPLESARCAEEVKKDIIRRAKKLAERGE